MRVSIDKDRCMGHGRCYALAPALVTDDEAGYGEVIGDGEVAPEHADQARRAGSACPEHAFILTERATAVPQ